MLNQKFQLAHLHIQLVQTCKMWPVTNVVIKDRLLYVIPGRAHSTYWNIKLNPLWKWDKQKTKEWIETKKKDFLKFSGTMRGELRAGRTTIIRLKIYISTYQ